MSVVKMQLVPFDPKENSQLEQPNVMSGLQADKVDCIPEKISQTELYTDLGYNSFIKEIKDDNNPKVISTAAKKKLKKKNTPWVRL